MSLPPEVIVAIGLASYFNDDPRDHQHEAAEVVRVLRESGLVIVATDGIE